MPWVETATIIYTGTVGSVIGGFITAMIHGRAVRQHEEVVEEMLRNDIKRLKRQVVELQNSVHLLTKPVDRSVYKAPDCINTHVL